MGTVELPNKDMLRTGPLSFLCRLSLFRKFIMSMLFSLISNTDSFCYWAVVGVSEGLLSEVQLYVSLGLVTRVLMTV
jgi:hypothetical protein